MAQHSPLSKREEEVVELLLQGNSNKLIASALGISASTVEFHLKNIYAKYEVSSRVELILKLRHSPGGDQAESLGLSTVESREATADNGYQPNEWNWATSVRDTVSQFGKEPTMQNVMHSDRDDGTQPMSFPDAIRVCFTKYADFNGRASRAEFWWFMLFIVLVLAALTSWDTTAAGIFQIAILLPLLADGTRRLRDSGKSGWWQLFLLAPVGGIVVLGFLWALPPMSPLPDDPRMV